MNYQSYKFSEIVNKFLKSWFISSSDHFQFVFQRHEIHYSYSGYQLYVYSHRRKLTDRSPTICLVSHQCNLWYEATKILFLFKIISTRLDIK